MKFFKKHAEEEERLRTIEDLLNQKTEILNKEEIRLKELATKLQDDQKNNAESNLSLDRKKNRLQSLEAVFKEQKKALTMLQASQFSSDAEHLETIIMAHINARFRELTPDQKQKVLNDAFDLIHTKTNELLDD